MGKTMSFHKGVDKDKLISYPKLLFNLNNKLRPYRGGGSTCFAIKEQSAISRKQS